MAGWLAGLGAGQAGWAGGSTSWETSFIFLVFLGLKRKYILGGGGGGRVGEAQPGRDILSGVGPADRKSAEHSVMKLLNYI